MTLIIMYIITLIEIIRGRVIYNNLLLITSAMDITILSSLLMYRIYILF